MEGENGEAGQDVPFKSIHARTHACTHQHTEVGMLQDHHFPNATLVKSCLRTARAVREEARAEGPLLRKSFCCRKHVPLTDQNPVCSQPSFVFSP